MKKVRKLQPGSKIAIISPSSGLPYLFPENYELGLQNLRDILGFEIVEMPTARMSPDELYQNPKLRADDINACFQDDSIDGIIASIGGYESVRILPYLDTELILNNPKMIMGFSDATTFLTYLNQLGMVTFYGSSVLAGFAQMQHLPETYTKHVKAVLFGSDYPYSYQPYASYTQGYLDWSKPEFAGQCKEFISNESGWTYLQGDTAVEGYLWGGCIEVLEFMKSTKYWPDADSWHDKILFFETSEEKPTPDQIGYMLRNYGMQGLFSKVKGIMFGRAKDYTSEENAELHKMIVNVVKGEFGASDLPIVVDVDFGHTDPRVILPLV
ncbi:LD-carboxypeptidase [Paenibacillus sp. N1-5-1-14]|uniref:S66 family peptidase n=1 Tax=Paenibacillus radicibacter TaxID=2972488 RepID=UPI002159B4C5|nr:S66 peptidase family protein [Paenibacillus radicibacter]MCR8641658.1 LD-carboxypeptidase [Paenibacillus radicibacter]